MFLECALSGLRRLSGVGVWVFGSLGLWVFGSLGLFVSLHLSDILFWLYYQCLPVYFLSGKCANTH